MWPGVRQAGLVKAEPGADAGSGAAQRSRLDYGPAEGHSQEAIGHAAGTREGPRVLIATRP